MILNENQLKDIKKPRGRPIGTKNLYVGTVHILITESDKNKIDFLKKLWNIRPRTRIFKTSLEKIYNLETTVVNPIEKQI